MKLCKNDNLTSSQMISGSWYQRPGGAGCTKQMHLVKWVSEHVPDVLSASTLSLSVQVLWTKDYG